MVLMAYMLVVVSVLRLDRDQFGAMLCPRTAEWEDDGMSSAGSIQGW